MLKLGPKKSKIAKIFSKDHLEFYTSN